MTENSKDSEQKNLSYIDNRLTQLEEYLKYLDDLRINNKIDEVYKIYYDQNKKYKQLNEIYKQLNKKYKQLNEIYKQLNKKYKNIKNIRGQLFAVLALFFGLFSFLSCEIAFSKNFLSYFQNANEGNVVYWTLVTVIVFQIVYISGVYHFIIKPFLEKIS